MCDINSRFLKKKYFNIHIPYSIEFHISIILSKVNFMLNPKYYRIQLTVAKAYKRNCEWCWWKHIILIDRNKK